MDKRKLYIQGIRGEGWTDMDGNYKHDNINEIVKMRILNDYFLPQKLFIFVVIILSIFSRYAH